MYPAADTVPIFLAKLCILVEDPTNDELIGWDPSGNSFHIFDQGRFAKEVLPYYFKHNNVASFIRQLNMYGFHKVSSVDQGSLKMESSEMHFCHAFFVRGKKHLLARIKRKLPTSKNEERTESAPELTHVLSDIHSLQAKQKSMNNKLEAVKTENGALWREVVMLRTKHQKQQQIVNKLIQFLVSLVGSSHGVPGRKRSLPMLSDVSDTHMSPKTPRYSNPLSIEEQNHLEPPPYTVQSPRTPDSDVMTPSVGDSVIIHELPDLTMSTSMSACDLIQSPSSDSVTCSPAAGSVPWVSVDDNGGIESVGTPIVVTPTKTMLDLADMTSHGLIGMSPHDLSSHDLSGMSPLDLADMTQNVVDDESCPVDVCGSGSGLSDSMQTPILSGQDSGCDMATMLKASQGNAQCSDNTCNKMELANHVDTSQTELDQLKDLLAGGQFSVDFGTLSGLFAPEYPMTINSNLLQHLEKESQPAPSVGIQSPQPSGSGIDVLPTVDLSPADTFMGGQALVQYTASPDITSLFDNSLDDAWYNFPTAPIMDLDDCLNTPSIESTLGFPKSETSALDENETTSTEEVD